jgi:ketosteroid isomerase-like protein
MAKIRGEGPQKDIDEIVRLHNVWVKANRTGSIPMMREAFVGADKFFGWNLNGFSYDGIEEWATLWKWLANSKAKATLGEDEDVRVHVRGDVGWLSCSAPFTITLDDGQPLPGSGKFRSTEVYVREDEHGSSSRMRAAPRTSASARSGFPRILFTAAHSRSRRRSRAALRKSRSGSAS